MSQDKKNISEREDRVRRALERIWRLNRLKELDGPAVVIEEGEKLVAASRADLGEEIWEEVLSRLPMYSEYVEVREKREKSWEDRCTQCIHWMGKAGLDYDPGDDYENDLNKVAWCKKYSIVNITRPSPCPGFSPDDKNN